MINNKNIGIVMPYYKRQYQLNKTLESINKLNYDSDIVVVIVANSDDEIILPRCDFEVKIINIDKKWMNPEPACNAGMLYLLKHTDSEIILLQHAECYYVGNVLEYVSNNVTVDNYITFGCYSINENNTFNNTFNVLDIINSEIYISGEGTNGWYNHPEYRPKAYDFCAAIHRDNLIKLNGHDERLSYGIGYGDNYLLHRVKLMNLNVVITEYPFVVHQWHYNSSDVNSSFGSLNKIPLIEKNRIIYNELINENNYRAVHHITDDFDV